VRAELDRAGGDAVPVGDSYGGMVISEVAGHPAGAAPGTAQGAELPDRGRGGAARRCSGDEFELPILVGLYCGLRPAEYLALRWRDLELEAGELRVVQTVHRVRQDQASEHMGHRVQGFRFGPTKTHRSRRPVAMPPVLVELLRERRFRQALERERAGAAWTDLDLVFTDARGYPHCLERVRHHFYRALERAGVRRVVLYALRHTMATLLLHETKDLKLVAARLGHADETLALRTYGHLLPG
jgi:integrase